MAWKSARVPVLLSVALVVILVSYTFNYTLVQNRSHVFGVTDPDSTELFDFIREHTPANSHIMFQRPRILALYTDRKASFYNPQESVTRLREIFRQLGATYLLVYTGTDNTGMETDPDKLLADMNADLTRRFSNRSFTLYQIDYHDASPH